MLVHNKLTNPIRRTRQNLTLAKHISFANSNSERPVLGDSGSKVDPHAQQADQQISNGQVDQKKVCGCPHLATSDDDEDDQAISRDVQKDGQYVE